MYPDQVGELEPVSAALRAVAHAQAAGVESEKIRKKVCALYNKGIPIQEIEQRSGRSRRFIYRVLHESGVTLRGAGRRGQGRGAGVAVEGDQHDRDLFQVALGAELRLLRLKRGWTRKDLVSELPWDVSIQTVTTWELGSRAISVARLVVVVDVLVGAADDSLSELIKRARRRTGVYMSHVGVDLMLDLRAASRTSNTLLSPLQRWALSRLRDKSEGTSAIIRLDVPALTRLAQVCDIDTLDLVKQLTQPGAELTRPWTSGPNAWAAGIH